MSKQKPHGCKCGECHWCLWDDSPVEAIKHLLKAEIEKAIHLERVNVQNRYFFLADRYQGRREEAKEILNWIKRQEDES